MVIAQKKPKTARTCVMIFTLLRIVNKLGEPITDRIEFICVQKFRVVILLRVLLSWSPGSDDADSQEEAKESRAYKHNRSHNSALGVYVVCANSM